MTRIVGLTGGIGSGKSTVAKMLAELGAVVIDADAVVHELQAKGMPMLAQLREAFGDGILLPDGALDRKALGERVFSDEAARERLNDIVHPEVAREMGRRLKDALEREVPLVVLDIPLLYEGRARRGAAKRPSAGDLAQAVIVVWAPREQQIERQLSRDGATREHAEARLAAQLPIDEKRDLADHVIDNSGSIEETRRQVEALFQELAEG